MWIIIHWLAFQNRVLAQPALVKKRRKIRDNLKPSSKQGLIINSNVVYSQLATQGGYLNLWVNNLTSSSPKVHPKLKLCHHLLTLMAVLTLQSPSFVKFHLHVTLYNELLSLIAPYVPLNHIQLSELRLFLDFYLFPSFSPSVSGLLSASLSLTCFVTTDSS